MRVRAIFLAVISVLALFASTVCAEPKETIPPGMGKYLIVLWDPGTPIPGDPDHKLMKRIEEPDYGKGGGRVVEKIDNRRVVYLPFGVAKQLRKHQAVAYIQPIYAGEKLDNWYDDEPTEGSKLRVRTDTDTNLTWDRSFSYDNSGNITAVGGDQYTYDTAGRLIQSVVNGKTETFKYDAFGNLIEKALAGTPTVSINVDPSTNKMNGGVGYDEAGNLTISGRRTYEYDPLNMMLYADSRRMLYDANDERIGVVKDQSLTRWTIRDFEGHVIREFKSDSVSNVWTWEQDYFYVEGRLVAGDSQKWGYFSGTSNQIFGGRRYYHLDHLGSVRIVTDSNGRSLSENDYYAFGATATKTFQEPINAGDPHVDTMRFAGHSRDFNGFLGTETDDYVDYMHARMYDPKLGRFLSVDPGRYFPERPQSWNRYAYVENNPVNYTDPDGRERPFNAKTYDWAGFNRGVNKLIGAVKGAVHYDALKTVFNSWRGSTSYEKVLMAGVVVVAGADIIGPGGKSKAAIRLAENKAAGAIGEAIVAQELKAEGQIILGSQVRAETSEGTRIIDHLVQNAEGGVRAVEVKTGNAVRNSSQVAKDTAMATEGATLTGKNAPESMKGQKVILDTEVRRPNQ